MVLKYMTSIGNDENSSIIQMNGTKSSFYFFFFKEIKLTHPKVQCIMD